MASNLSSALVNILFIAVIISCVAVVKVHSVGMPGEACVGGNCTAMYSTCVNDTCMCNDGYMQDGDACSMSGGSATTTGMDAETTAHGGGEESSAEPEPESTESMDDDDGVGAMTASLPTLLLCSVALPLLLASW